MAYRLKRKFLLIGFLLAGLYLIGYGIIRIAFEGCCINWNRTVYFYTGDSPSVAKSLLYYLYLPMGRIDQAMTGHGYEFMIEHPDV